MHFHEAAWCIVGRMISSSICCIFLVIVEGTITRRHDGRLMILHPCIFLLIFTFCVCAQEPSSLRLLALYFSTFYFWTQDLVQTGLHMNKRYVRRWGVPDFKLNFPCENYEIPGAIMEVTNHLSSCMSIAGVDPFGVFKCRKGFHKFGPVELSSKYLLFNLIRAHNIMA